jgi:hypothetical protein
VSAQSDLHYSLNRAGNAAMDAAGACRTAARGPIRPAQRALIKAAERKLNWAMSDLWEAGNEPTWQPPATAKHKQLQLI